MSSKDNQKVLVDLQAINNLILDTQKRFSNVKTGLGLAFIQGELQGIEKVKELILKGDQ